MPELWIEVAAQTGIPELRITTRDEPDYDRLMRRRLRILRRNRLKLRDVQKVIEKIKPLPGARAFLDALRERVQVIILSDTYYEFMPSMMRKLGRPTLFCNSLEADSAGYIKAYHLRQKNGKEKAVRVLKRIGFEVRAAGDSYNDIAMLRAADHGVLFNPPPGIAREFPEFAVTRTYPALLKGLTRGFNR